MQIDLGQDTYNNMYNQYNMQNYENKQKSLQQQQQQNQQRPYTNQYNNKNINNYKNQPYNNEQFEELQQQNGNNNYIYSYNNQNYQQNTNNLAKGIYNNSNDNHSGIQQGYLKKRTQSTLDMSDNDQNSLEEIYLYEKSSGILSDSKKNTDDNNYQYSSSKSGSILYLDNYYEQMRNSEQQNNNGKYNFYLSQQLQQQKHNENIELSQNQLQKLQKFYQQNRSNNSIGQIKRKTSCQNPQLKKRIDNMNSSDQKYTHRNLKQANSNLYNIDNYKQYNQNQNSQYVNKFHQRTYSQNLGENMFNNQHYYNNNKKSYDIKPLFIQKNVDNNQNQYQNQKHNQLQQQQKMQKLSIQFLSLINYYQKGQHLNDSNVLGKQNSETKNSELEYNYDLKLICQILEKQIKTLQYKQTIEDFNPQEINDILSTLQTVVPFYYVREDYVEARMQFKQSKNLNESPVPLLYSNLENSSIIQNRKLFKKVMKEKKLL